eukprot:222106-Lingulodinium_polyedra.AAC.1
MQRGHAAGRGASVPTRARSMIDERELSLRASTEVRVGTPAQGADAQLAGGRRQKTTEATRRTLGESV